MNIVIQKYSQELAFMKTTHCNCHIPYYMGKSLTVCKNLVFIVT